MNKKLIAFLSILSLFLTLPLIPVNAAAKSGGACSKAGITSVASGKTYTCIKSGKKLVWDKGVLIAKVPSQPASTEVPDTKTTPKSPQAPTKQVFQNVCDKDELVPRSRSKWVSSFLSIRIRKFQFWYTNNFRII